MLAHSTALTRREWQVLDLIAEGRQHTDVAEILIISPHTVKAHSRAIRQKLGACNAANAVYRAIMSHSSC